VKRLLLLLLLVASPAAAAPLDTLRFVSPRWMPYPGTCDSLAVGVPEDSVMVLLERLRYPEAAWVMVDSMRVAAGDSSRFFVVDLGGCSPCAFRKWARDRAGNVSCNPSRPVNLPRPGNPVGVGGPLAFQAPRVTPVPVDDLGAVTFAVPRAGFVSITLYDIAGRLVRVVVAGYLMAGPHVAMFEARSLAPGVYFIRMRQGEIDARSKVIVLR